MQVVAVASEEYTLGGSGNVANNLVSLGAKVSVLGVIGTGKDGKLLLNKLQDLGVDARGIVQEAMKIAASVCIYTNDTITIEEI